MVEKLCGNCEFYLIFTSSSPFLPHVWRGDIPEDESTGCWLNSSGGGKVVAEVKSSLNSGLLAVLVSVLARFCFTRPAAVVSSWKVSLAVEAGDRSLEPKSKSFT